MTTTNIPHVDGQRDLGTVDLAGTTFHVTEILFSAYVDSISGAERPASSEVFLTGPRGASYFLRRYIERAGDSGIRQVISHTSGQPFRKRGNEIKVIRIGDVIEVAA